MTDRKSDKGQVGFFIVRSACCLALVATICCLIDLSVFAQDTTAVSVLPKTETTMTAQTPGEVAPPETQMAEEDRWDQIEKKLQSIETAGKKSEERSYFNKMIGAELIGYVRLMVIALIVIAVGFPVTIWLLSRKRILGLSGLSTEVAATLLVIEERQAKLANILKEIQGEIDYLHTMSVPDLKNLIQQAESYLKQNEEDLEKAGSRKSKP
ncbi:MAG: hypothetical protein ACLP5H_30050 [Desulfomonilaceae bacterium]